MALNRRSCIWNMEVGREGLGVEKEKGSQSFGVRRPVEELDEQMSLSHINQDEYEQKKKKLSEESRA